MALPPSTPATPSAATATEARIVLRRPCGVARPENDIEFAPNSLVDRLGDRWSDHATSRLSGNWPAHYDFSRKGGWRPKPLKTAHPLAPDGDRGVRVRKKERPPKRAALISKAGGVRPRRREASSPFAGRRIQARRSRSTSSPRSKARERRSAGERCPGPG